MPRKTLKTAKKKEGPNGWPSQATVEEGIIPAPLPSNIRILGKDISVDYAPDGPIFADSGQMDESTLAILVRPGQLPIEEVDVILHEFFHALDYVLDLELTEHQVRLLGTGVAGVLQDNPEFAAFVTRRLAKPV